MLELTPAWGGAAGVSYRLGDHWFLAVGVDLLWAGAVVERALGLEVAWGWY